MMAPATIKQAQFPSADGRGCDRGLIASTALSLFVVPVLFSITDDLQQKLRLLMGKPTVPDQDAVSERL